MLNQLESKITILLLRAKGYDISGIHSITGLSLTHICEVIYEQNGVDKSQSRDVVDYKGVF